MSIGLGCGDSLNMEQLVYEDKHQEIKEVNILYSRASSGNHQGQEILIDTHEFVGAPKKSIRKKREQIKFNDYMALVNQ